MVNLRRYNIQLPNLLANPWGYTSAKNGEWVKFNDIKELLNISTNTQQIKAEIAELEKQLRGYIEEFGKDTFLNDIAEGLQQLSDRCE